MNQQNTEAYNDRWVNYYASILQECWRQEIEEAIDKVKREVHVRKHKRWRRKRGYWTPTGFAWFKRKRAFHYHKGRVLNRRILYGLGQRQRRTNDSFVHIKKSDAWKP